MYRNCQLFRDKASGIVGVINYLDPRGGIGQNFQYPRKSIAAEYGHQRPEKGARSRNPYRFESDAARSFARNKCDEYVADAKFL